MTNKDTQTSTQSSCNSAQNNIIAESMETNDHEDSEETEPVLQCTICNYTLKTSSELDNHIESVHAPAPASSDPASASAPTPTTDL